MTGCQPFDIPSSCYPVILTSSMPAVPVVPALGPEIRGADVRPPDGGDPLDVLHAVFDGNGQAKRRAVVRRQRLTVQPPGQQRLRMHGAGEVEADVVAAARRLERDVAHRL